MQVRVAALTRSVCSFPHNLDVRGIFIGCTERLEDAARRDVLSQLQHDDADHAADE